MNAESPIENELKLLSVVIPARDEEGCIASTVEKLHVELRLNRVPHEIVVVDDGSSDRTWEILQDLRARIPTLAPTQNPGRNGFGRAVICGLDQMKGDAVVVMMADESDDSRDVVRSGHSRSCQPSESSMSCTTWWKCVILHSWSLKMLRVYAVDLLAAAHSW